MIGIVDDVRDLIGGRSGYNADPRVTVYVSTRQALTGNPAILATSDGDVLAFRAKIVDLVRTANSRMIVLRQPTLAGQFDEAFAVTRVFGALVAAFAVSALALSTIGIYGVISFGIIQRTREIGIRCALGGTPSDILRMIVLEASRFVGVGLVIGIVVAAIFGRLARFMLFDVSVFDPASYAFVSITFGLVALLACYVPARRATRVSPMVALRAD